MIQNNRIDLFKDISPETLERISKSMQDFADRIKATLKPLQPLFKRFAEAFKDFPESTKILAAAGWYMPIDLDFGTANHLANELQAGNVNSVNEILINYFDDELQAIENDLVLKFPNRQAVIKAALFAHESENYYLSIPVFFAQAEGIAKELTSFKLFQLRNNEPTIREWADEFDTNSILSALIEPLRIQGPMRKKQDPMNPSGLNRHDVLHGDSVDYGDDKLNSYKALSLLNYIGETVYLAKERTEKDSP